jgi:hypothetical protein
LWETIAAEALPCLRAEETGEALAETAESAASTRTMYVVRSMEERAENPRATSV